MIPLAALTLMVTLASVSTEPDSGDGLLHSAEADMTKLNEYLQADKENEINVESL